MYSPEAWIKSGEIQHRQAAFPLDRLKTTKRIRKGSKIFAYVSKFKQIAGILEVTEIPSVNPGSSEFGLPDQYPIVASTRPLNILPPDDWLAMEDLVGKLRLFRGLPNKRNWPMSIRLTPRELASCDTELLVNLITNIPANKE
jgi:hypothetical protein